MCITSPLQIIELANEYNKKIKVIGSGHSPSDIGCTDGFMINMDKMNRILSIVDDDDDDSEEEKKKKKKLVTVEAGIKISKINKELFENHSLALNNLGSISDQTIAGAISTGTHGTGIEFGCLHTQVYIFID